MRRRTVTVDGIATAVVEAGEAEAGTAVVFVHGNPGGLAEFLALVETASPQHRAIAMDMPGFGSTPAPDTFRPSVPAYAAHLAGLLDALGVTAAHLVLHDFGGPWGLAFAADHPDRVRSLLLLNAAGMPGYRWHRLARLWRTPVVGEALMAATTRPLAELLLREGNPTPMPDHHVDRMVDQLAERGEVVLELYRDTDPAWGDELVPQLRRLDVPVLVAWGDRDPYLSTKQAERFRDPFPRARFVRLRDVGHWPMLTAPDVTATVLRQWLSGHVA